MAFTTRISARSPLLLVGCGHMGGVLLHAWRAKGLPAGRVVVVDPRGQRAVRDKGIRVYRDLPAALREHPHPRIAVLAVKPQAVAGVLRNASALDGRRTPILSIAAGIQLRTFTKALGPGARAMRAMPNTPAAVGKGVSVMVANLNATAADRTLATTLLAAVGKVFETRNEGLLDAVTAVSGSGPAYFYLLTEALASAGRSAGLPKAMAEALAAETFFGAAELLQASGEGPAVLRARVTSKGGTTEAALKILAGKNGVKELMKHAVKRATARGRRLAR
jgi:pyrroline-5-carboxylate reductase